jgi:tetratricopeptide (TPR) repeat protein/transglutaminase-like putative cysteine protease
MPKPLSVVLCLFLATAAPAVTQTPQTPEKPQLAKSDYSQEAVVFEQDSFAYTFANDGTFTEEHSARIRVQSDAGLQQYGILAFSYASGTGDFSIEYIRVHKPDGSVVETPLDTVQDMPAEITRQAPFYSDLREKHAPVKGLSIGDTVEYKTVSHLTKPVAPGQFGLDFNLSPEVISLHEQLTVIIPRDRPIKLSSAKFKPTITDSGNQRVYTWTNSNLLRVSKNEQIEQAKTTYQQARGRLPQPDIRLSTFQSWDEVGRWYASLQAYRVKPTPEIVAKAAELTKAAPDDDAKIRAIYSYVSSQFRYIGIAFGVGRYQPHFAAEVLANQYGDCKDKHTLLAALLAAAGIKAYPALINSQLEIDNDVPSPSQFNHVITVVPRGNALLWLDSTTEIGPFQYLIPQLRDKHALVMWDAKPATFEITPASLPYPALQNFKMDAKLDDSGTLDGNAELSSRGDIEVLLRLAFRSTPMPQWKDLVHGISIGLGFAGEVSDISASSPEKTDEPFRISYKYHRKDYGDWPNHRIVSPIAMMHLPEMTPELHELPVPLWLGPSTEFSYRSRLELPEDYIFQIPDPIHLKRDFAEFDATYSVTHGVLISDRRLRTLQPEVSKPQFGDYEAFCKTVLDDYSSFIQLFAAHQPPPSPASPAVALSPSFLASYRSLPGSSNQDAIRMEAEAWRAFSRGDLDSATSSLHAAVAADPKYARAWAVLGEFLWAQNHVDAAMDAFQKAIAANPDEPTTHRIFALSLSFRSKFAEAVPQWQAYTKLVPDDPDGFDRLGLTLMELKRYDEAVPQLATAVKLYPDSPDYQAHLASAYANIGNHEKAAATYNKLAGLNPPPTVLNHLAYEMAESDKTPSVALDFAQKAARAVEDDSTKIDLQTPQPSDEGMVLKLAAYWVTLGRVQQRLGKSDDAEKTLASAWKLTQDGMAAAYLCELYLAQNKTQPALQMCRLARNRLTMEPFPVPSNVPKLIEQNDARLEKLSPGASKTYNMKAIDQITDMRDYKVPASFPTTATAEFSVLLEFDPQTNAFKVCDVKYVSGAEKLRTTAQALKKVHFNFASPDGNPFRILRQGTFLCSGSSNCEFLLPDATRIGSRELRIVPNVTGHQN